MVAVVPIVAVAVVVVAVVVVVDETTGSEVRAMVDVETAMELDDDTGGGTVKLTLYTQ